MASAISLAFCDSLRSRALRGPTESFGGKSDVWTTILLEICDKSEKSIQGENPMLH